MPEWDFNTTFIDRMKDAKPLAFEDFRDMLVWIKQTYNVKAADILNLRVAIQLDQALGETRQAIRDFDTSSRKLTRWLIGLTIVLVVLTGVITWLTVLLLRRG